MKDSYVRPQMEEMEFDVQTVMMDSSWTDVGGEGEPDIRGRRGRWATFGIRIDVGWWTPCKNKTLGASFLGAPNVLTSLFFLFRWIFPEIFVTFVPHNGEPRAVSHEDC